MLNLITVLQALIKSKYSLGTSVLAAALSKKSLTCSRNLGSWNSSSFGPKLVGSSGLAFDAADAENKALSKIDSFYDTIHRNHYKDSHIDSS